MVEEPAGIAIVGCAHIHMGDVEQVLAGRGDVRCVGVWDREPARAAAWAERVGAPSVTDVADLWANPGTLTP